MADDALETSIAAFRAATLDLLDQLAAHGIPRVVVTKRGRPVALLAPPMDEAAQPPLGAAAMERQAIALEKLEFTSPVLETQ